MHVKPLDHPVALKVKQRPLTSWVNATRRKSFATLILECNHHMRVTTRNREYNNCQISLTMSSEQLFIMDIIKSRFESSSSHILHCPELPILTGVKELHQLKKAFHMYYRGYCMNQSLCYLILTHVLHNVKLNKTNKTNYM